MRYLLVVLICNGASCEWKRQPGIYHTEERCVAAGLMVGLEKIARFKCIMQAKEK